jgi:hypothetical protein
MPLQSIARPARPVPGFAGGAERAGLSNSLQAKPQDDLVFSYTNILNHLFLLIALSRMARPTESRLRPRLAAPHKISISG